MPFGGMGSSPVSESGGNPLVSVADLMAGLLFVFIITLMVFAISFSSSGKIRSELLQDLKKSLDEVGVQVTIDEENGILRLPEEILFESGQAELPLIGQNTLRKLGGTLSKILPCYSIWPDGAEPPPCPKGEYKGRLHTIFVEGHTDNVPIRTNAFPNNWHLSSARAITTYRFLVGEFPTLESLRNIDKEEVLSVSAYADRRPVRQDSAPTSLKRNRRIDLRFIMATPTDKFLRAVGLKKE